MNSDSLKTIIDLHYKLTDTTVVSIADTLSVSNTQPEWQIYLLIISPIIAMVAVLINWKLVSSIKSHNILSVKPSLRIDSDFSDFTTNHGFTLSNHGLGPAIIRSYKIFWENLEKPTFVNTPKENAPSPEEPLGLNIYVNTNKYLDRLFHKMHYSPKAFYVGEAIKVGEKENILQIDLHLEKEFDKKIRLNLIKGYQKAFYENLKIRIEYESLYGEELFLTEFPYNNSLST